MSDSYGCNPFINIFDIIYTIQRYPNSEIRKYIEMVHTATCYEMDFYERLYEHIFHKKDIIEAQNYLEKSAIDKMVQALQANLDSLYASELGIYDILSDASEKKLRPVWFSMIWNYCEFLQLLDTIPLIKKPDTLVTDCGQPNAKDDTFKFRTKSNAPGTNFEVTIILFKKYNKGETEYTDFMDVTVKTIKNTHRHKFVNSMGGSEPVDGEEELKGNEFFIFQTVSDTIIVNIIHEFLSIIEVLILELIQCDIVKLPPRIK